MISAEFLAEEIVGPPFIAYNNVKLMITQHYFDRLRYRRDHIFLRADYAEQFLYKVGQTRKKMAKIDPGQQFWVVDHESGIAFGLRRLNDDKDGHQVNVVGTVVTPCKDGTPGLPNGNLNPIIHMA